MQKKKCIYIVVYEVLSTYVGISRSTFRVKRRKMSVTECHILVWM